MTAPSHQTVPTSDLDTWAASQVCPECGNRGLRIEWRLVPNTGTDYSLAGVQTKYAATGTPFVVCGGCGLEKQGKRP